MNTTESQVARIDERTRSMEKAITRMEQKTDAPCPHHTSLSMDIGALQTKFSEDIVESKLDDAAMKLIIEKAVAECKLGDAELKKDVAILTVKVAGVVGIVASVSTIFLYGCM